MPHYNESDIANALNALQSGVSLRKAAKDWGIPLSTLHDRFKGSTSIRKAMQHTQRLSADQESSLANWVLVQGQLGLAPTHEQIRDFVRRILAAGGDHKPLGKHWISGFYARNPKIKTLRGKRTENSRIKSVTAKAIKAHFDNLDLPAVRGIPPECRWNMDETGIMEGFGINGLVVGSAERKSIPVKSPQSRVWTSIVECISATGRALPPAVIFRGKAVQQQWFPEPDELRTTYAGWLFTSSPKGWIDHELALEWLQRVFIPETHIEGQARLLILDGHGSHVSTDFMWECFYHNIYLLYLPAHSSHITQPCDLSCFSVLKRAYRRHIGNLAFLTDSSPIGKRNFLRCYHQARIEAFTYKTIRSGWLATGLWPVNINKPLRSALLLQPAEEAPQTVSKDPVEIPLSSDTQIVTPLRSNQMLQQIKKRGLQSARSRLLIRKIGKGLDANALAIAQRDQKIRSLELEIERLKPQKRMRVIPDPNKRFVEIQQIGRAQAEAAAALAAEEAIELAPEEEEIRSCIWVEN